MWRLVLLCMLLTGGVARAAVATSSSPDCPAVRSFLLEKGVAESALSSSGAPSEVCRSGSCCSRPWELGIRDLVHRDFRRRLVDSTDQAKNLMHHQAATVQDAILRLIHNANQSTISSYSQELDDRQGSDDVALHALPTLFGKFMRYFQSNLSDPELETAITDFFDDLFVVTYGKGMHLNATFENCLREKRMEVRPFREVPLRMKEKLLRTFGVAKFYLQSLYGGLSVLNTTTQFQCSDSCYQALTRLSYCPLCHGFHSRPCNEFCFNVMRGCMAPLSTLAESWQSYVEVLRKLATSLQSGNNVGEYLMKVYVNISEAMSLVFAHREEVDGLVQHSCGILPASADQSSRKRRRRRRRDLDMQYRSSGDLGGALPPLPRRQELIDFESEGEPLNKLLRTFNSDVELHKGLFQTMPEEACNDMVQDHGRTACWNGTALGDYQKPVAGLGLDSQVFNPEVVVPQIPDSTLKEKADLLDQIRQGSNDKLATMPAVGDYVWSDLYDGASGYGSGDDLYGVGDDEDGYGHDYYDYGDMGSGSGDDQYGDDEMYPEYGEIDDETTLLPTPGGGQDPDGDLQIPGETDQLPPGVDVDSTPPVTTRTTTKRPPAEGSDKPAGAAAVAAAGCWTLLAAALLAARL